MNKIILGDCIEEMKKMPENSVDAIVTDPPYGIGFMGKEWDNFKQDFVKHRTRNYDTPEIKEHIRKSRIKKISSPANEIRGSYDLSQKGKLGYQVWCEEWSKEALRILKPGGFMLVSCSTRMYHRMTCGIEDAGFEIRDTIMWLYGSGFPKSLNIGKQIDKMGAKDISWFGKWLREWREKNNITQREIAKLFPSVTGGLTGCVANWELGLNIPTPEQFTKICRTFDLPFESIEEAEREVIGNYKQTIVGFDDRKGKGRMVDITTPATQEAKQWEGWGTALKPACEPIVVARKPLSEKNVALNVLKWGTGGMNIDESRIGTDKSDKNWRVNPSVRNKETEKHLYGDYGEHSTHNLKEQGRFPANIILDEESAKMLDEQSAESDSNIRIDNQTKVGQKLGLFDGGWKETERTRGHLDKGGASRFFYVAKASKSERNFGCEDLEEQKQDTSRKEGNPGGDNPRNIFSSHLINLFSYVQTLRKSTSI